jgi:hypothetical protein
MLATLGSVSCFLIGAALGDTRIGVLPVSVAGDPILAQTLTTALVAEIRQSAPATEVFGPDDVRALVGAAHAEACADASCFAAMAAGAGVDQLVVSSLLTLGPSNLLTLTLLDTRRNLVLGAVDDRAAVPSPSLLTRATLREAARDGAEPLDRLASAVARLLTSSQPQWVPEATAFGRLEVLLDPWPIAAGRIDLRVTQPGALALVDDRPLQLGVSTEVPAGLHRLRIVSTDFKRAQELMVEVKPGVAKTVQVDLGRGAAGIGRLEVDTEAGTRIDCDGQTLGIAPLGPVAIAEGAHEIRLVHGTRGAKVQIAVASHATVRVAPPLVVDSP